MSNECYDQTEIIAYFGRNVEFVSRPYNLTKPMEVTTDQLPRLLQKMVEDIKDPNCFYWIYSGYFDVQRGGPPQPTERTLTRWQHTPLFINYDALWNAEFVPDGMLFDVILKNQLPAEKERIKLEYDQIRLIKRTNTSELRRSETDPNVFYQSEEDSIIYRDPKGRGLFGAIDEVNENGV